MSTKGFRKAVKTERLKNYIETGRVDTPRPSWSERFEEIVKRFNELADEATKIMARNEKHW